MSLILFKNMTLLDVKDGALLPGYEVLIRNDVIDQVAPGPIAAPDADVIDLGGRTLMPGLIDCHVHICADGMHPYPQTPRSLAAALAFKELEDSLMRGFTTLRDAGGADLGYKLAIERGLVKGPRLFISGFPISQTGGHGDNRFVADPFPATDSQQLWGLTRIVDGVDAMRRAVREELRMGADQIKITAGGGVASPADSIHHLQYSEDELRAAVEEAEMADTYVMAHIYSDRGIRRAVEVGIKSIEHGNFLERETADRMAEKGAFLVPTLIVYRTITRRGKEVGVSKSHLEKASQVLESGTRSIEIAKAAGVKMAYGSDLFRAPSEHQSEEFLVRGEALPPIDIIRSATLVGAELLGMTDRLGIIAPGAFADLLVIDGNPIEDLQLLQNQGARIPVIMKGGTFVKNSFTTSGEGA